MSSAQPLAQTDHSFTLEVRVVLFTIHKNTLQVLLETSDQKNVMQLPGQPVTGNAALDEIAQRCVLAASGGREAYLEQLYTYGDPQRCAERRCITVAYFALLAAGPSLSNDEQGGIWFPVDDLPAALMDHADILAYALRRLRYKLEYSAVGFELLPDQFTLTNLQQVYEIVLGEQLDKRNFRRRILEANIIEPTDEHRGGEGRPALLYRYRPDAVAEVKARRLFP
jgi:8-oxo-dGTP diphosphatase